MKQLLTYQTFLKSCISIVLLALSLTYVISPLIGLFECDIEMIELVELEDSDSEEKENENEKEKEWREQNYLRDQYNTISKGKVKLSYYFGNSLHLFHYVELLTPPPERISSV